MFKNKPDQALAGEEHGEPTAVQLLGERIARRELLRRGGKFIGALAFLGAIAGTTAESAYAVSPFCSDVGCACSGGTCFNGGQTCPKRTCCPQCPSGGQCWSEFCSPCTCTYCDWWCNGTACRCLKVQCPGAAAAQAA
jgi:hypothetical protein